MNGRISVTSKFKRVALNIEEKADVSDFSGKYLPTRQAEKFVGEVARAALQGGGAHALSGAYGAGKSSLAIFVMNQLCCKTKNFSPVAFGLDNATVKKHCKAVRQKGGMLGIPVVGAYAPLGRRIVDGAKRALSDYVNTPPESLKKIAAMKSPTPDNTRLLSLLGDLADDLRRRKKAGVLLIVDEFGRHLERMVGARDASDVYLLQGLAELAGARKSAFSLLVVQHYGMEHYSRRLLGAHRPEWEKTRGRFSETWLENTERDIAEIAASLFRCSDRPGAKEKTAIKKWIKADKMFQSVGGDFAESSLRCWPLHPATIMALAKLSAYLGQNDRTVVSWILSDADSGFIKNAASRPEGFVYPAALYRHFLGNPQNLPANPVWARRVSEICAADERFQGDDNALMLMHTIAALNCVGGGIAGKETLQMCLPSGFPFEEAMASLLRQSLAVYRKHRNEYCIWQGSDYDFAGEIAGTAEKMADFSLAGELNRHGVMPDIVAYRYLIETGNFQTLPVKFLNSGDEKLPPEDYDFPRAVVYLNGKRADSGGQYDVVGALKIPELAAMGREAAAMRLLLETDHRLQEDAAARSEIERQLQFVKRQIEDAVFNGVYEKTKWRRGNETWDNPQSAASAVMKAAYSKGFSLHNELINRNRSGGTITAALRGLCAAMAETPNKENLGIKKFPPHLLIYKNFLEGQGLHARNGREWGLVFDSAKVKKNLRGVVAEMEKLLFKGDSAKPLNVQNDILDILARPPYGVKQSPGLILCVVCMLCHKNKLALYEDGEYAHNWGRKAIERFLGDPSRFSLSSVLPTDVDESLLAEYYAVVGGEDNAAATVVSIARTLLVRYSKFDFYGLHSDSVSSDAQKFRRAVVNAKSPADLLFKDLPAALNGKDFTKDKNARGKYFRRIKAVLKELSGATGALVGRLSDIARQHYKCDGLRVARLRIAEGARIVSGAGRIYPLRNDFLQSALNKGGGDMDWLKSVAMSGLGAKKALEHWTDADEAEAEVALRQNIVWLQHAAELLQSTGKNKLLVTVDPGVAGTPVEEREIESAVEVLRGQFPEKILPQAIAQINYHLCKEGE